MTPTWLNRIQLRTRAGYSLLEMVIALAIMGLAAALIVPRGAAALDQVVVHSVFFDFQRQISDLRATAFADQRTYDLVSSQGAPQPQIVIMALETSNSAKNVTIALRAGWQYRVSQPIRISSGGLCSGGAVDLINLQHVAAHLETHDGKCHFLRTN
jgi:prepilin-type N-terminal cleavage/methylation domain-containing protein